MRLATAYLCHRPVARVMRGALLAFATCVSAAAATQAVDPGRVRALRFTGVSVVDESELREHILTRPDSRWPWAEHPPPFDEDILREDLDRLTGVYARHGYYGARAYYELVWSPDRSEVDVEIQLIEGEPVLLETLSLDLGGAPLVELGDEAAWRSGLGLRLGEPFSTPAYAEAKQRILDRVKEQGFLDARLEGGADVDPIRHTVRVAWALHAGPRVRRGELRIVGLESVDPELVQREVDLAEADIVTPNALRTAQRAIYDTGLFRTVSIQALGSPTPPTDPDAQGEVRPVEIRVEERRPRSVRTSLGYGTEDGVRAGLGWEHRNLFGAGRRFELVGKYSSLVYGLSARFVQPFFPDADSKLFARARLEREEQPGYDADRVTLGPGLERRFGEHLVGRVGYTADWTRLLDSAIAPQQLAFSDDTLRLGILGVGLAWTDLDDVLDPRRGLRLDLSVETATRVLGSQVGFVRTKGEARAYASLGPTVLAFRLGLGTTQPIEGDVDGNVPIYERFFTGGSTTIRGFDYHDIGPKDADGDPLGGLSLLEASSELRFPLWGSVGGVVFVDAGRVARQPFDFTGDLSVSAGAGLRYETPVGPLRLDVGRAIHNRNGADGFRIHFSIGQAF